MHHNPLRDAIPAHYGSAPKMLRTRRKERWAGVVYLTWQHLAMCILFLVAVCGWIAAHRCTGSRCTEPAQPLESFVYSGDFHRSRQLTGTPDSTASATRAMMLPQTVAGAANGGRKADTLVVYVYSPTDPEYANNLRYFLRQGVHDNDGCDYVFVLQSVRDSGGCMMLPHRLCRRRTFPNSSCLHCLVTANTCATPTSVSTGGLLDGAHRIVLCVVVNQRCWCQPMLPLPNIFSPQGHQGGARPAAPVQVLHRNEFIRARPIPATILAGALQVEVACTSIHIVGQNSPRCTGRAC